MAVICAGTSGFNLTMDARFLWMRQKRVQGSHFAHLYHASQANQLVIDRRIDPAMGKLWALSNLGRDKAALVEMDMASGPERVLAGIEARAAARGARRASPS